MLILEGKVGDAIVRSHECADCGSEGSLVNRWNGQAGSYEVLCGRCKGNNLRARKSITQRWREDPQSVHVAIANRLEEKYGGKPMATHALATIDQKAMLQRMEGARWTKELAPQDRVALAELAVVYGLDPVMGELVLYEGKPYITTAGHLRKAAGNPRYEGLSHRPLTGEERVEYAIVHPVACRVEVYKRGMRVPAVGIGTADPNNPLRGNPLEKREPYRQALSRATRQALRMYFPHGLPVDYAEEAGIYIDAKTGEIVEGPPEGESVIDAVGTEATEAVAESHVGSVATLAPEAAPSKPMTEEELKADARGRIEKLLEKKQRKVDPIFIAYCKTSHNTVWGEASLDQLNAIHDAVRATVGGKGEGAS